MTTRTIQFTLGALLGFGALNAFGGAYYGMTGAAGVPKEWLDGSPFSDYFVPSLILGIVVGGSLAFAGLAVLCSWRRARLFAFAAVSIVLGWLAVQLGIVGYVSFMQPVTALVALVILLLASRLPNGETATKRHQGAHDHGAQQDIPARE